METTIRNDRVAQSDHIPNNLHGSSRQSQVATIRYGEEPCAPVVHAFVVSRLVYVLSFLRLGPTEKSKLDCLNRKPYKRALNIPDSTSNEKLAAPGLHNTVEQIIKVQRISQLERLKKSVTGRHISSSLGIHDERQTGEKVHVPKRIREALIIPNIPKHMHPVHHVERGKTRVKALRRLLSNAEGIL